MVTFLSKDINNAGAISVVIDWGVGYRIYIDEGIQELQEWYIESEITI